MRSVNRDFRYQATLIERQQPAAQGLSNIWDGFLPNYLRWVTENASAWMQDALQRVKDNWDWNGQNKPQYNNVKQTIQCLRAKAANMQFPRFVGGISYDTIDGHECLRANCALSSIPSLPLR